MKDDHSSLEAALKHDRPPAPGRLRDRVLGAVSDELRGRTIRRHRQNFAAAAALFLLWCHVSWTVALNSRPDDRQFVAEHVRQNAAELHHLLPDLPESELRRMALVMSAGQPASRR